MSEASRCEACRGALRPGVAAWHRACPNCGTEVSDFSPSINTRRATIALDEARRARGLASLRATGYARLLAKLRDFRGGARGSLLEVGSAHGWFLELASSDFDRAVGIEPDDDVRTTPAIATVEVRAGYFPDAMKPGESFSVVVFNDVFEHIPDVHVVVQAIGNVLDAGGMAVLNLPVSGGALYRVSKALYKSGMHGPFERMWQMHFPSPHLYYFSDAGLKRLFKDVGFELLGVVPMPTLCARGLWDRIRYAQPNLAAALATFVISAATIPLAAMLPADIKCFFFRKIRPTAAIARP